MMRWSWLLALAATSGATCGAAAADEIEVQSVLIRLIDEVEVPAKEAGVLAEISAREGQTVTAGETLAKIDDSEAQLAVARAQYELEIAEKNAGNDVSIRFAKKSLEVARAELARSTESVEKYQRSISQTEIDRLRLAVERAELEVEQAEHDLEIARHVCDVKRNDLDQARHDVERRQIVSPIDGIVVGVGPRRGEWVEPGEKVVRILRLDLLRAEGFIDARQVQGPLAGAPATIVVDSSDDAPIRVEGKVVFASPEIDPVNEQMRVWVEIDNQKLTLPGMRCRMTIHP